HRQLVGFQRILEDPVQLLEYFFDRWPGHVGPDACCKRPRARRTAEGELRRCPVGVSLLLAQVVVDAAREEPAKSEIHDLHLPGTRGGAGSSNPRHAKLRLWSARLVDQDHARGRRLWSAKNRMCRRS